MLSISVINLFISFLKYLTVLEVVQSTCKFDKILVIGKYIEQNFVYKILVLEIN